MKKGFTLVELVIVIAIVIVLSVVSVPIYRSYVEKAKFSEGYALLGVVLSAQKAYYSEYGNFLVDSRTNIGSSYDERLGVDARGNKYFTLFFSAGSIGAGKESYYFHAGTEKPIDLRSGNTRVKLLLQYNITKGVKIFEGDSNISETGYDSSWM